MSTKLLNSTCCPNCGSKCNTIKTKQITLLYREVTYLCQNHACKHIFVASIEPRRTLSSPLQVFENANPLPAVAD